jgi:hypothetical protein
MPAISEYRYNFTLSSGGLGAPPPPGNGEWVPANSEFGEWIVKGDIYGCSNWSPSPSSQGKGVVFEQIANDCSLEQNSWEQKYKKNTVTGELATDGPRLPLSKVITTTDSREAIGILENWLPFDPSYTNWIDTNSLYGCTSWSPNPATFTVTSNFTQTSNTCKTDQERQRQEREQEKFTAEIRNVGSPIVEQQTATNQTATRPYSVILGAWAAVGESYACSNWSPAAETVGKGIKFTQSATDCKQDQTRTRSESFQDHKTGQIEHVSSTNETRTLSNQAGSKESTGTMEQWVATTPTYSAWVTTNAQYACSNWSPTGSSKSVTTTFTQTATDCKTDQTHNRQDREQESTTLEIRDKGVPVAENQTLTAQSATRNYTVTVGSWADSGAKYACANWSPSPATIPMGQNFTQTATDCKQNQTRARAESYIDHKTGVTTAVVVPNDTQVLSNVTNTQTAVGQMNSWSVKDIEFIDADDDSITFSCSGSSCALTDYQTMRSSRTGSTQSISLILNAAAYYQGAANDAPALSYNVAISGMSGASWSGSCSYPRGSFPCLSINTTNVAAGSYSPSITVAVTKPGGSVQTLNLSVPNWTVYPNDGWLD